MLVTRKCDNHDGCWRAVRFLAALVQQRRHSLTQASATSRRAPLVGGARLTLERSALQKIKLEERVGMSSHRVALDAELFCDRGHAEPVGPSEETEAHALSSDFELDELIERPGAVFGHL